MAFRCKKSRQRGAQILLGVSYCSQQCLAAKFVSLGLIILQWTKTVPIKKGERSQERTDAAAGMAAVLMSIADEERHPC